jgi:hypothetical protein
VKVANQTQHFVALRNPQCFGNSFKNSSTKMGVIHISTAKQTQSPFHTLNFNFLNLVMRNHKWRWSSSFITNLCCISQVGNTFIFELDEMGDLVPMSRMMNWLMDMLALLDVTYISICFHHLHPLFQHS